MSFPSRRARITLLAGVATLGVAGTANAAVTTADYNTTTKALTVAFDGDTNLEITCEGGNIRVEGAAPTRDGAAAGETGCAAPTSLAVTEAAGNDASANVVDLRGVTRGAFTSLATSSISTADGTDTIFGTEIGDTIDPGDENDTVNAHDGNDTTIWNPGDDSDVMNGGDGVDTVLDVGGTGDETFEIKPNGERVSAARINNPFNLDIGGTEKLTVQGNGGNDTITGAVGLAGLINLTITGGDGNDAVTGGDGNDVVAGDAGNDTVLGARGNDDMSGGDGDDLLVWNPGEGTDKFEGGAGNDIAQDNGGAAAEHFIVSANGQRVTATRDNGAPFFLDIGTSETLDLNTAGGDDTVDVNGGLAALIKVDANLGDGNDSIKARNDSAQTIDGAAGNDTATVDATDQVTNVEKVSGAAAKAKPKAKLQLRKLQLKNGKVKVKASLPAGATESKGRIRILRGKLLYGQKKVTLKPGKAQTFSVKITRAARVKVAKAPGKKLRVTLKMKLTDAAGTTAVASKQLNLKG